MNKFLVFSFLMVLAQIPVSGEENKTRGEHSSQDTSSEIIGSWSSNRASSESFEASFKAIKLSLEKVDPLDSNKVEFLSNWVTQILNGQNVLLNRAKSWLGEVPSTLSEESREKLVNLSTLYLERIKRLEELQIEIQKQVEVIKDLQKLRQELENVTRDNAEENQNEIMRENLEREAERLKEELEKEQERLKKEAEEQRKQKLKSLIWS